MGARPCGNRPAGEFDGPDDFVERSGRIMTASAWNAQRKAALMPS
jgi:hypothetical protein